MIYCFTGSYSEPENRLSLQNLGKNFDVYKQCNEWNRTTNPKSMNLMDFPLSHVAVLNTCDKACT